MLDLPTNATLQKLLTDSLRLPPEYNNKLSSHLPMALAALAGLGADDARLRTFFEIYTRRFQAPASTAAAVPAADWPSLRGEFAAFETLRSTFAAALAKDGRDAVLRQALPLLIPGVGAVAFHGAIRVAHAVESGHTGELAAALAYWAARWTSLPPPRAVATDLDHVGAWLDALDGHMREHDDGWQSAAPLIAGRMQAATLTTAYRNAAGRLRIAGRPPGALLADLARTGAARYAATRNFTVLHIATVARAVRVLEPWLPDAPEPLAPVWHAVAAASLASGMATTAARSNAADAALDWPQVRALALASDDDHVIKLVHAMADQHAIAPEPTWLRAAVVGVTGAI